MYRLSKVVPAPQPSEDALRQDLQRLRQRVAASEYASYVAGLRARADVAIHPDNLAKQQ